MAVSLARSAVERSARDRHSSPLTENGVWHLSRSSADGTCPAAPAQRTASTARSSSPTENAPSSFVRITPFLSTTNVNGSLGRRHCVDPAVHALGRVVVLVDLDVDESDRRPWLPSFAPTATTWTTGPQVRVWQYSGVANVTTNGRCAAIAAPPVVRSSSRSGGSARGHRLRVDRPCSSIGVLGRDRLLTDLGRRRVAQHDRVAERLDLLVPPIGSARIQYLPGFGMSSVVT